MNMPTINFTMNYGASIQIFNMGPDDLNEAFKTDMWAGDETRPEIVLESLMNSLLHQYNSGASGPQILIITFHCCDSFADIPIKAGLLFKLEEEFDVDAQLRRFVGSALMQYEVGDEIVPSCRRSLCIFTRVGAFGAQLCYRRGIFGQRLREFEFSKLFSARK